MSMKVWVVLVAMITCVGCGTTPIQEGILPRDTSSQIAEFFGVYQGSIRLATADGRVDEPLIENEQLELGQKPDGSVVLKVASDWLGKDCGMKIGKLLELRSFGTKRSFFDAKFEFNPGKCQSQVRSPSLLLELVRVNGKPTLKTFLAKEITAAHTRRNRPLSLNYFGQFSKFESSGAGNPPL